MNLPRRTLLVAALCLVPAPSLYAQSAADPSGHWDGAIQAPGKEHKFEVDLAKNSKGELAGTFSNPAQNVNGYPLTNVAVDGRSIHFLLKVNSGGGPFDGVLSADGKSIAGDFTAATPQGNFTVPFSLTRTGDARIGAPPKSAPIGKELEGTWNGTLDVNGKPLGFVLKMSNHPDGTATGSLVSVDQGVEIPVTTITQKASSVILDVKVVGATYSSALNADGTELVGTWTEGPLVLPLTFRRAGTTESKK
jgi:hypothetical protein